MKRIQRALSMSSETLEVKAPPSSRFNNFTTPSSTSITYLLDLTSNPIGLSLKSNSHLIAFAKSPFPSLNSGTSSLMFKSAFHAFITKASLTEIQVIVSTPFDFSSLDFSTNLGRCF
ncbi:unnamed protein product [Lactuca virosa]|uniref:Uncharacterized protein n=1 Tax=Lactuca virosa TaxID=75947 RepID=A0AAU9MMG0_9ASTR|nr:unnamed protein product [Lactuca virosa]